MNRKLRWFLGIILLLVFVAAIPVFADQPPDPGGGPGSGDPPVGGGSPIGGGLIGMLVMSGIYGLNKIRLMIKSKK